MTTDPKTKSLSKSQKFLFAAVVLCLVSGLLIGMLVLIRIMKEASPMTQSSNQTNQAQINLRPILSELKGIGASPVCAGEGDDGNGIDNTRPWFRSYYRIEPRKDLQQAIVNIAAANGYLLQETENFPLEGSAAVPEKFLAGSNSNTESKLTVKTYTNSPGFTYCVNSTYGKPHVVQEEVTIIDMSMSAPEKVR